MFLVIWRTIKESVINFWRNGWLSIAAVSVLLSSLFVVGTLFVVVMTANNILKDVESKINVSIYFKADVDESEILRVKSDLENYGEIQSVSYISKDKALEDFKKNNADEPVIIQSLEEIGDNPLLASLVIKANDSNDYQKIADYVANASFSQDVSRVNYGKNRDIISKLNNIIYEIKRIGLVLAGLFSVISILIIFNTIRITIYTHRQEIEVMRLVGASNAYIRLPFIFEGVIYGLLATILATFILFIVVKFVAPYASTVIPSQNLVSFYFQNLGTLFGIQAAAGIFLGVVSSWIAMRKYLRI